jgi:hypothetical protein
MRVVLEIQNFKLGRFCYVALVNDQGERKHLTPGGSLPLSVAKTLAEQWAKFFQCPLDREEGPFV